MDRQLPSGTVCFLFTDVEGSTLLWERDRAATAAAVDRHLALLREAIAAHGGVHFKTVGDAVQAAFPDASRAVAAALEGQLALLREDWGAVGALPVRMALHAGEAVPDDRGDYLAAPLNRLSRLLASGYGGQVLVSQAVQQLVRGTLPSGCSLRDLGEHRLKDLLEPERIFQLLHPGLPADFPPPATLDPRRHNLPRQPTPFLGREREVAEVVALLCDPAVQLLTLTGPGGTGKTRLALQAAADALGAFPDGAVFVPLAQLTNAALVPSAVAQALGVREGGGRPTADALRDVLAAKKLLLVLDNCEHLLETAADLAAGLLAACSGLTVLATSRAPLRLRAEREWVVPPLELPRRPPPPPTPEQLFPFESVRLFVERARAVQPDFAVDNASAPAVAELCWRLDGLPLAIELAAARVRLFGPEALVARLDRRLPLLTGGPRDAPARQRTLRDAISWSYDLLEEPERVLFRRLAVFAGGWSFEAAESVADLGDGLDVFGGLASLVDKSLVHRPGGGTRFGMLETIREFAEERLAESGEAEAVREAHAAHVLAFAERAGPEKLSPDVKARRREWDAELANLRAVLAWLERRRDADGMLRLAAAFADSAIARGQHQEALGWLERALSLGGPAPARLQALFWAAAIAALQGDPARNASWGEEGLDLSRRHGDAAWEGRLLYALELGAWTAGNFDAAVRWGEVAVERLRAQGDRLWLAYALGDLGTALVHRGEAERGVRAFDEGAAQHRAVGNGVGLGIQTADLAFLLATGDPAATRHLRESVRLLAAAGDRWWLAGPLAGLARRAADADRPASAARLLGASGRLLAESGADNRTPQERAEDERTAARARAGLGEPGFARELAAGQALPLEDAVAAALDLADELESGSD